MAGTDYHNRRPIADGLKKNADCTAAGISANLLRFNRQQKRLSGQQNLPGLLNNLSIQGAAAQTADGFSLIGDQHLAAYRAGP